jgi:hypothetical protein
VQTVPLTPAGTGTARAVFAPLTAATLPILSSYYAVYSGDGNYPTASSDPFTVSIHPRVPIAHLSTSAITFGSHRVGSSSTKLLTITNDGTGALTLSSAFTTGQPFGLVHLTCAGHAKPLHQACMLQPHQRATLTVRFHPTGKGSFAGKLELTDNGANSPQVVTLAGSAK